MKAIFFDIDGTLIEGRYPGFTKPRPKVIEAIKALQSSGHYVFIASGRSITYLNPDIKALGFDGYVLLNGATIFVKDKLVFQHSLDHDLLHKMLQIYDKHHIQYALLGAEQTYINEEFNYLKERLASYGISNEAYTTSFDKDSVKVSKLEVCSSNLADTKIILEHMPKEFTYVKEPFREECAIDIFDKRINKATGIEEILKYLGIPKEESYAFGDGDNDIEMLGSVGTGFAMGNGTEGAKAAADVILPSIFDDGVVTGIEQILNLKL